MSHPRAATRRHDRSPDLAILETRVYRGPNLWSYEPADPPASSTSARSRSYPTNTLPGFVDGLLDALPGVARHSCSRGHRGGFLERLKEGTWLGHVAEHVALQLQQEAGHDIRRGKTRGTGEHGSVQRHLRLRRRAGRPRGRAPRGAAGQPPGPAPTRSSTSTPSWSGSCCRRQRTAFGPSTQAILDEAVSRDIPWLRLNEHSLVQLGQGVHQQRIRATMTSNTSALAVDIAGDKELTTRLLAAAGLPVPRSESVRTRRAGRAGRPTGSATPSCASRWTATTAAA